MPKIDSRESSQIKKILMFLISVESNPDIHTAPLKAFYLEAGELLSVSAGTIQNSIFHLTEPRISRSLFLRLQERFQELTEGLGDEFKREVQLHAEKLIKIESKVEGFSSSESTPIKLSPKEENIERKDRTKNLSEAFLNIFQHSIWSCYERNEKAISRKIIQFEEFVGDTCNVTITTKETAKPWQGQAVYDEKDHVLIITTRNTSTKKDYTHYLIAIDTLKELQLCIGHATYRHRTNLNIVSKAIILLKVPAKTQKEIKAESFDLSSEKLEKPIRLFFQDRKLNRLSSPHKTEVYNLNSLGKWIDQNIERTKARYIHKPLLGEYYAYYKVKPSEKTFVRDSLKLFSVEGELKAEFRHKINARESVVWKGDAFTNFESHSLSALLSDTRNQSNPDNTKPNFILLDLPDKFVTRINTLIGIATGPRDENRGSVSRLIVFIKKQQGKLPSKFDLTQLKDFFDCYSKQSWIRPPFSRKIPCVYDFMHLKQVVNEYSQSLNGKNAGEN